MSFTPARTDRFKQDYVSVIRKNRGFQAQVDNKLVQILDNPEAYKPLKKPLHGYKRAHIGPYVVTFRIKDEVVIFTRLAHHDEIYWLIHD
jgi:mRNA-degrading endonuclease RelE of RelBE toxin-antitoxin system